MLVIGVNEHVWQHSRRGDKYVSVMIDLTPIRDGTGPARLLDMIEGHGHQGDPLCSARRTPHTGACRRRAGLL